MEIYKLTSFSGWLFFVVCFPAATRSCLQLTGKYNRAFLWEAHCRLETTLFLLFCLRRQGRLLFLRNSLIFLGSDPSTVREINCIALDFRYSSFKMVQVRGWGICCSLRSIGVQVFHQSCYPSLKIILIFYELRETLKSERGEVARMLHWEF